MKIKTLGYLLASLVITTGKVHAKEPTKPVSPDYTIQQFDEDVGRLIPLAGALKGKCLADGDQKSCDQAESIMRLLRGYAMANPSGEKGSYDSRRYMELARDAFLDGYAEVERSIER